MRGLDNYPSWIRITIGLAFFAATMVVSAYSGLGILTFMLGTIAVALLIPRRKTPTK